MLPFHLEDQVRRMAEDDKYLAHPDGCENMCGTITYVFTERLRRVGMQVGWAWLECHRAIDIHRYHRLQHLSEWHICLVYGASNYTVWNALPNPGTVVDFTARQYWPTAQHPLIEPLDVYRQRFRSVNMISLGFQCSGPSRMARKDRYRSGQFRGVPA